MKLITDIHKLPFTVFLDCLCDGDFTGLVISGEASQADIMEAWANLWYQYVDLNGDNESLYILEIRKESILIEHRLKAVESFITILNIPFYVDSIVEALADYDIYGISTPDDPDYFNSLNRALAELAPQKLKLQSLVEEILMYEKGQNEGTIDRAYFRRMLIRLSKFQGYAVREDSLMTSEFVYMLREYISSTQKNTVEDGEEN